jgi:thiol-disulfide isomerase/thioredoxin
VSFEFFTENEPHLNLPAVKIDSSEIYFHGIPKHNELESFVQALKLVAEGARGGNKLSIITFVSPLCPNCRATVDAINSLLSKYPLRHHIVDATMFPEFAEEFEVMSVPTTIMGKMRFVGALSVKEAELWVENALSGDYKNYIAKKLMNGEIEVVKALVSEEELGEVLGELMAHREFMVRLGAMAAAEALKDDKEVVEGVKRAIRKLLKHEDARIREDVAMVLGLIGGEEDIEDLERLASEGGRVGESAIEAVDEIRRRKNG